MAAVCASDTARAGLLRARRATYPSPASARSVSDARSEEGRVTAPLLLRPGAVFDGETVREGWSVLVDGDRIVDAGAGLGVPDGARVVELPGATLLPG